MIIGPRAAGFIADGGRFSWRYVYLFSLPPALILFIPAVFTRFPEEDTAEHRSSGETATHSNGRKTFFDALRSPMVWLLSITLGFAEVVEMSSSNWGPLYFSDVYGLNPEGGGASFLSAFFLVFTISRLVCGPFVERIGYVRSLLACTFIALVVFAAGFFLGKKGIYVLPALGFFVALLWPTIMAVAVYSFGRAAPVFSSAIIAIAGLFNAGMQFLIGITNKALGPAWGYRSSLIYTVLLIVSLFILNSALKRRKTAGGGAARKKGD